MMYFGKQKVQHWAVYLSLGIIAVSLLVVITTLDAYFQPAHQSSGAAVQALKKPDFAEEKHGATDYLINKLKHYGFWNTNLEKLAFDTKKNGATDYLINKLKQSGLWQIHPDQEVPRFFIESYPDDLHTVEDITIKKRIFLHSLLPHALFVRHEALQKRGRLESILNKINCSLEDINFDTGLQYTSQCSWPGFLAQDEINFIQKLCRNYRTTSAESLLERVDAVPTSIILAQGALESSWGSSRFAREGNSLFGMWTWKTQGIVPSRRDEGKTHKVKSYENILDSVRAYHITLNRLNPYDQFRQLRRYSDDPLILAEGLTPYSARGKEYVEEIKNIIQVNDLQKYDSCRLSDFDTSGFSSPATKKISIAESAKTAL